MFVLLRFAVVMYPFLPKTALYMRIIKRVGWTTIENQKPKLIESCLTLRILRNPSTVGHLLFVVQVVGKFKLQSATIFLL